jgi:filamentous hemagglutinin
VKQSWNDAKARNGTVGASAMVLTTLGTEIIGQKGTGMLTHVAVDAAEGAAKVVAKDAVKVAAETKAAAKGGTMVTSEGVANAVSYQGLKLDLQTTQAANEVVESLRATGQLPSNYVTKTEAVQQGWRPGKALNSSVPGSQMGGDVFQNITNILPSAPGRTWFEADIGLSNTMSRSNQSGTRLLYSSDGLLYITTDHYGSATSIGIWK